MNWLVLFLSLLLIAGFTYAQMGGFDPAPTEESAASLSTGITDEIVEEIPYKACEREAIVAAQAAEATYVAEVHAQLTYEYQSENCEAILRDQERFPEMRVEIPSYCATLSPIAPSVSAASPSETQEELSSALQSCKNTYLSDSVSSSSP